MLCIFIYYIPQLPRLLSGPVCYLGYNPNATNADLWSELADEANGPTSQSSLGLGLKCKTAKVIMKAVYGVTVGCWILSVLVALVQLRFLSKKYIRDLTAVVRGSIVPFPRGKRPRPFYALYKCTTFIGRYRFCPPQRPKPRQYPSAEALRVPATVSVCLSQILCLHTSDSDRSCILDVPSHCKVFF
eukprot:m.1603565 g.1603565  ORF g.1603565 m.1603565 type:complete len:187 (+) comp25355_c1_seq44:279-839(+)